MVRRGVTSGNGRKSAGLRPDPRSVRAPRVQVPRRYSRPSVKIYLGHQSDQLDWTARPSSVLQLWDAGMGGLTIAQCAKQRQSGWVGGARIGVGVRDGGERRSLLYTGPGEGRTPRTARKSLRGSARGFSGEWLPLPASPGGPGRPQWPFDRRQVFPPSAGWAGREFSNLLL